MEGGYGGIDSMGVKWTLDGYERSPGEARGGRKTGVTGTGISCTMVSRAWRGGPGKVFADEEAIETDRLHELDFPVSHWESIR